MVGSIGSVSSSMFQYLLSMPSTTESSQNVSFDNVLSANKVDNQSAADSVSNAGGTSSTSSSSANSEMDLNNDGQVTIDEVIRYTQMQMTDKMSEQMSSEDGAFEMGQQAQSQLNGMEELKNKQAASAYGLNQNNFVDMITSGILADKLNNGY